MLPGTLPALPTVPSTEPTPTDATAAEVREESAPPTTARVNDGLTTIGRLVDGNRVLVIGDSILASISSGYGDQLCEQLVPKGWEVEVAAEVARFVDFGREVIERRPVDEWDAAVVMLGNNYDGDPQAFTRELRLLLNELEPLPVLLLNVTRFEPAQDEVNWIVTVEANRRDDVQLLDWTSPTADDAPRSDELLTGDGLHLTADGQEALATLIGRAMGRAPSGSAGECLRSTFRDDSAGSMPDDTGPRRDEGAEDDEGRGPVSRPGGGAVTTTTTTAVTTDAPDPRDPTSPPDEPGERGEPDGTDPSRTTGP